MLRMHVFAVMKFLFVALGVGIFPILAYAQGSSESYVYFVSEDVAATSGSYRASTVIEDAFNARIATTWEEVEAFQQESPLSALIIDNSALSLADQVWVASAYQQGIAIVGLNIPIADFADLVGDACLTNNQFAAESYPGDFFIAASQLVLGENAGEVERVKGADRASCGSTPAEGINGLVAGTRSRATSALETGEDFRVFTRLVENHVEQIAESRQAFSSGALR